MADDSKEEPSFIERLLGKYDAPQWIDDLLGGGGGGGIDLSGIDLSGLADWIGDIDWSSFGIEMPDINAPGFDMEGFLNSLTGSGGGGFLGTEVPNALGYGSLLAASGLFGDNAQEFMLGSDPYWDQYTPDPELAAQMKEQMLAQQGALPDQLASQGRSVDAMGNALGVQQGYLGQQAGTADLMGMEAEALRDPNHPLNQQYMRNARAAMSPVHMGLNDRLAAQMSMQQRAAYMGALGKEQVARQGVSQGANMLSGMFGNAAQQAGALTQNQIGAQGTYQAGYDLSKPIVSYTEGDPGFMAQIAPYVGSYFAGQLPGTQAPTSQAGVAPAAATPAQNTGDNQMAVMPDPLDPNRSLGGLPGAAYQA